MDALSAQVQSLEAKIETLNEKIDAQRSVLDNWISSQQAHTQNIGSRPQDSAGIALNTPSAASDPALGFSSDEAVKLYRKDMVLFRSKNYPDAVLGFSAFVDRFPDHALAGSAQYFLAEGYFAQHQPKLAAREYQRVLMTYDRSPHIADTLERIAECEDVLGNRPGAAKHREMLMTLFPASPAAARAKTVGSSAATASERPISQSAPQAPSAQSAQTNAAPESDATNSDGLDSPPPTAPAAEKAPDQNP